MKADGRTFGTCFPLSWTLSSNAVMNAAVDDVPSEGSDGSAGTAISTCSRSSLAGSSSAFTCAELPGDREVEHLRDGGEKLCIRESISIFSSFSSSKSFNSLTSASSPRTRSSRDSVYPLGKARRLSLSLVLHSNPTLAHCVQHGRIPSHLIFLLRHLSQACAIRLWVLLPTRMTFIGNIPGMLLLVLALSCTHSGERTEN
jgi:hypothetical protein